ncbi:hypothetical protein SAMN06265222_110180 [Neorhodopirellula lusitana]|uniref:Uncharacterized protein n=1 Tax=Neorhodopirellula lusitana TaxID=445327 RepID=A0ABY1QGV4_9BACT|nr:hypothetical protein SAMN06265222_110180 [Neorhodopirellula lusitana]
MLLVILCCGTAPDIAADLKDAGAQSRNPDNRVSVSRYHKFIVNIAEYKDA